MTILKLQKRHAQNALHVMQKMQKHYALIVEMLYMLKQLKQHMHPSKTGFICMEVQLLTHMEYCDFSVSVPSSLTKAMEPRDKYTVCQSKHSSYIVLPCNSLLTLDSYMRQYSLSIGDPT